MRKPRAFMLWLLFCSCVLASIVIIAPGWGLMDDSQNLRSAEAFLKSTDRPAAYAGLVKDDISQNGRFRPFYFAWIVSAYSLFGDKPTLFYFFVVLAGLLFLPIWGRLISSSYGKEGKDCAFLLWVYPLSFFFFTPFWNNFMYLSILEKFIYFFSPLAFGYFFLIYRDKSLVPLIAAAAAALCGLLSKETGISVFISFFIFSLIAAVLFRSHRATAVGAALLNGLFIVGYYLFIKKIISAYSSRYEEASLFLNLIHSPAVIKALFACAFFIVILFCRRAIRSGSVEDLLPALWPIFVICYLFVLSPWGYMNYLLAPLGPCVMAMLWPVYDCFWRHGRKLLLKQSIFVIVCFCCLAGIIIPRTMELGSVKEIVGFLRNDKGENHYFFPASSPETPLRLSELTAKDIRYPKDSTIRQTDMSGRSAYLVLDRLSEEAHLIDLKPGKVIYKTDYWAVVEMLPAKVGILHYKMSFPATILQRLIRKIKNS